ncbi:uncharacterized protein YjbK [Thermolongibacillus altinsuensis]|jgi:uncharacterized protein YjbK|uniref:Uncharacterized protein YjbK n=1 Tax=Thermolongibacillus altinsuensis TaxID=575256 RepID=A0A4R1QJ21_9BACL|nr:CYTH domain-containing protein [Thermolongibacillus altinsuensis]TCL51000.1 uncharacterized protein YjbK [Thermolongibacillus altinsuensis]GMB08930.1 putative triphosphatase YjbK [Thermolongibacillus altinsuensis]
MNQEVEIEFKNLLTKEEFLRLKEALQINENEFNKQENHYFDTSDFQLKQKGSALRLRIKKETYTLTLKQPHAEGLLETHEFLSKEQAQRLLNGETIPFGKIAEQLTNLGIVPSSVQYFGTLITKRAERSYEGGLIVLDHSHYLNVDDYEMEYEATNRSEGEKIFQSLLEKFQIPKRETKNKIERFYLKKYEVEG